MGFIGKITSAVKGFFGGIAEDSFAAAGGAAYVAAAGAIAVVNRAHDKKKLDAQRKQLLRPDFGEIVDEATFVYDAQLTQLKLFGKQIGTDPAAQTFGDSIYLEAGYKANDAAQLELLAHELTHVKQFRKAGSLYGFGHQYFREYYRAKFDYDDNDMEEEADRFAQCFMRRVNSTVQRSTAYSANWQDDWSSIMPFGLAGRACALLYKKSPGSAKIIRFHEGGDGIDQIWEDDWSSKWSHFMPFNLNGEPHFLCYKTDSGSVAIHRIRPDGAGVQKLWSDEWSMGWTSFMPFDLNGAPHFLIYKAKTGRVAIQAIGPDGKPDSTWTSDWSKGWTSFMPFTHNGTPHYLSYKYGDGEVSIGAIKATGKGATTLWRGDWSSGWTNFVPISSSGQDFVAYKGPYEALGFLIPGNGLMHVSRVRTPPSGIDVRWCTQRRGSWRCVSSFPINGVWHALFYGADGNDVHLDKFVV